MKALVAILESLRTRPSAGLVSPALTPFVPAVCIAPNNSPPKPAMTFFSKAYASSPLIRFDQAEALDLVDVVFGNASVQRAAAQCALRLAELHELAAIRSEIGNVVDTLTEDGDASNVMPATVVAALNRRAEQIDAAIAEAREDKARHDEVHKARLLRIRPLRAAASELHSHLTIERDGLDDRLVAMKHASKVDEATRRFENLIEQGLTAEQIKGLGVERPDLDAKAQAMRDRIASIDPMIIKLKSFGADPFYSPHHLIGLGLDDVIASVFPEHATVAETIA